MLRRQYRAHFGAGPSFPLTPPLPDVTCRRRLSRLFHHFSHFFPLFPLFPTRSTGASQILLNTNALPPAFLGLTPHPLMVVPGCSQGNPFFLLSLQFWPLVAICRPPRFWASLLPAFFSLAQLSFVFQSIRLLHFWFSHVLLVFQTLFWPSKEGPVAGPDGGQDRSACLSSAWFFRLFFLVFRFSFSFLLSLVPDFCFLNSLHQ